MKNADTRDVNFTQDELTLIKKDRMRFTKNKLPSNLTLLAIVVNVFYFVSIYKSNARFYYEPTMGISVLFNLVFMLAAFLSSEGIKNYKKNYGVVLIVLGALQLLRIIYYPLRAHSTLLSEEGTALVMENAQFIRVLIYLISSAALLISGGVIGIIRSNILTGYRKEIGEEQPS